VKGTTNGVVTDFDGNFSLNNVKKGDIIQISFVGYQTVEMAWNGQALNITMQDDTQALDELVVVGYGVMRKSDVTGSISVAKGEELMKSQSFSAMDALRGKAAGVNVFSNSSQPGAYANRVVIRGQATINASSDPLYVVDGVVMENFHQMNPNDIESMEILKDASATAIYGARGANGVILVTTKRGKKGGDGTQISYQGSVSVSSIARKMELLDAQEWCDAFMKGLANENKYQGKNWSLNPADWFTDREFFDANGTPLYNTDWQDVATRTALSHNHQLNIQQASGNSSMGAFLNYTDQQGIVETTYSKRLNAKIAYDAKPTKWLSTAVNLAVNHTWGKYSTETSGGQDAARTMVEMLPWIPVYDKNGNYSTYGISSEMLDRFGFEAMVNPLGIMNQQKRMNYNTKVFGNAALTFHLAEGMDLKTQFGMDANFRDFR
jgi:TonB-linked SusC/RagA family outer membrane protein